MNQIDLEKRLIKFSVKLINLDSDLNGSFAAQHLYKQIVRSGTSFSLNYGEARGAESKRDFIHKLKICLKELRESHICLKIIFQAVLYRQSEELLIASNEANE